MPEKTRAIGGTTYETAHRDRKVRMDLDLVAVARRAAARAAAYLRATPPPPASAWTEKARADFASETDRTAERLIAEVLGEVPGSSILGEELTPSAGRDADVVWIVDPLDGTTNYLHGYPQYAVSIGCVVRGALCVGVVHDVARDLVYHAEAGRGAWCGDARLRVSSVTDPKHALVGTGFPFKHQDEIERYMRQLSAVLRGAAGARRAGSAALDLADVAAGRFDAFWEQALAPWDVAAGVLLVREAGGVVTTLDGEDDVLDGRSIVAGNPVMQRWLLELLQQA
jgi:myo-inositol-1(or 4)-monophosphatase